jgi:isoleucyl-tRNA synthetase
VADEVNVKEVVFADDVSTYCQQVLTPVPRVLGPRLGGQVQQVIKAIKAGDWTVADGVVTAGGVRLADGEYELRLVAADVEHSAALPGGEGVVVLNTEVTPELAAEGLARDVIRVVQMARREADLAVTDRISLTVGAPAEVVDAVRAYQEMVATEVLATTIALSVEAEAGAGAGGGAGAGNGDGGFEGEVGDGQLITVRITPAG